jgi:hypothetical protein
LDKDPSVSRAKEVLLNEPIADPEVQEETIARMVTRFQERISGIVQPSGDSEEDTTEETDEEKIERHVNENEDLNHFKSDLYNFYRAIEKNLGLYDATEFLSEFQGAKIVPGQIVYKLTKNDLPEKKIILIHYLKENKDLLKSKGILAHVGIMAPKIGGIKKNKTVRNKINKLKRRTYKKRTKPTRRKNYKMVKPSRKSFNKL